MLTENLIRIEDYKNFDEEGYSVDNLLGLSIDKNGKIQDIRLGDLIFYKNEGILDFISPEGEYIEDINYIKILQKENLLIKTEQKENFNIKEFSISEAKKHPEKIVTNHYDRVTILHWDNYKNKDYPIVCLDDSGNVFSVSEDGLGDNGMELLIVTEDNEDLDPFEKAVSENTGIKDKKQLDLEIEKIKDIIQKYLPYYHHETI